MCTVVIYREPDADWPVLVAANRDEMRDRPWRAPGRHWRDRPNVVAGQDELAGGSWMGLNDEGVVAAILNRVGSLGPDDNRRSRGELVLEALDHGDAASAAKAMADINPEAYRTFNLVVLDARDGFWVRHDGGPSVDVKALPAGFSMITAADRNDTRSPRIRDYLPRFVQASRPRPDLGALVRLGDIACQPTLCRGRGSGGGAQHRKRTIRHRIEQSSRPAETGLAASGRRPARQAGLAICPRPAGPGGLRSGFARLTGPRAGGNRGLRIRAGAPFVLLYGSQRCGYDAAPLRPGRAT